MKHIFTLEETQNESLLREKTKKQMKDLNRAIKSAGGDIQDIVKKGEKVKEYQIPNAYYMDNPFDAKRTSIETQEHFVKNDAHKKSTAMKSKEQKNIIKLNAGVNENIDNDSLRTMNAHFQTYVFPYLTNEEQEIIKKIDVIIFRYNYDNETSVRLSFKTPQNREDVYQLILVNVTYPIYKDMIKIVEKFDLVPNYDNKNKIFLNIYYKNKRQNMNTNRRINEGSQLDESVNESKEFSKIKHKKVEFVEPFKKLNNLKHFHELSYDGDTTEKSNLNDDSWIKGRREDFVRPMFKNLPDPIIRPSYDTLRNGQMITLFGRECRVEGIKNGELTVSVMGKDNKHETEKYDMKDVMKELKKTQKKEKKSKK